MGSDRKVSCCGQWDANKGTGSIFQCFSDLGTDRFQGHVGRREAWLKFIKMKWKVRRGQLRTCPFLWYPADAVPRCILILCLFRDGKHVLFIFVTLRFIIKKYAFGNSDDQKYISHMYLIFVHSSWLTALKSLGIS